MPDYFISACTTDDIEFSQINIVRAFNSGQTSRKSNQPSTTLSDSVSWFRNTAAARCVTVSTSPAVSASEFRTAQVLTACISTTTESYKYYYANCNNGKICICVNPDTVNNRAGCSSPTKFYQYSKDNGATFTTCTNDNTHVFTCIDGGGNQSCGKFPSGTGPFSHPGSFRRYNVVIKDETSNAVLKKQVDVTYNSTSRNYPKVQGKDDTSL